MDCVFEYQAAGIFGTLRFMCNERGLCKLALKGQKHWDSMQNGCRSVQCGDNFGVLPAAAETKEWLDCYFSGGVPGFIPTLALEGSEFRMTVWKMLLEILYGHTVTYNDIAKRIAVMRGVKKMAAQAVGGAVGNNPVSLIVPCHRVVGSNGTLVGYGGGLHYKMKLLELEGVIAD